MYELKRLLVERLEELLKAYGFMEGVDNMWERQIDFTVEEIQQELIDKLSDIAGM
ncbi:MAG: hypothetical protein U5P10_16425 [Spirochaetia bacterium]|nr:hypothetical protein [Spirochaetia bacterium]